jgi:hypothetical protein
VKIARNAILDPKKVGVAHPTNIPALLNPRPFVYVREGEHTLSNRILQADLSPDEIRDSLLASGVSYLPHGHGLVAYFPCFD